MKMEKTTNQSRQGQEKIERLSGTCGKNRNKKQEIKNMIAINLKILIIITNVNELNASPKIQSLSDWIYFFLKLTICCS